MSTLASGKKSLSTLIGQLESNSDMNEAQTRFHILDKVLFHCLNWQRDDIEVERCERQKFTDYELGKPRIAILEAKREGRIFEIPAGLTKKLIVDIASLIEISNEAKEAIEQVQDYCSKRGVPIAIVSNGHQFVVFIASRQDGISILEGNAVVFKSLEHLKDNFDIAWQLLSVEGIKERNIFRYLHSGDSGIPNKLSSKLVNYPTVRYGSEIQATLRQLSELFLQDVIESEEIEKKFFLECYCDSGALSKYALLSKSILEARYSSLFSESESKPHVAPIKERKKDNFSPDILSEAIARRPIVLLGDVGVGKTSFVKNLMYNSAYKEFKNALYIYIDLGSKAALTSDLRDFILHEIERQLLDKYSLDIFEYSFIKGVYASEIHRFSTGLWGRKKDSEPDLYETKLYEKLEALISQKDQHIKKAINQYSKSTKRQVIIALDNADQRDFDTQQAAFIISQELAKEWNSTVFVAVRPKTFFKSKRSGALTAYPHKIFTISPPRIDYVIKKRLSFALSMAEGKIPIESINYVKVNAGNLAQFIKALLSSLSVNSDLYEFLTNITGGNIRSAIEFVTGFIGTPNVDAEKIIDIMNETGKYQIPLHEFTKSALLGDYSHYNPDTSIAMNVFDVSSADKNEHFLIPIIISYLNSRGNHRNNDGFCTSVSIFNEMQDNGFTSDQTESALRRATNKKLIETSQRITFEEDVNGELVGDMPTSFRITSIGSYHLLRWLGTFTYLDAMIFDTPIFETNVRDKVAPSLESFAIQNRYDRAIEFKKYLTKCWNELPQKPKYFNFLDIVRENSYSYATVQNAIGRTNSKHRT